MSVVTAVYSLNLKHRFFLGNTEKLHTLYKNHCDNPKGRFCLFSGPVPKVRYIVFKMSYDVTFFELI